MIINKSKSIPVEILNISVLYGAVTIASFQQAKLCHDLVNVLAIGTFQSYTLGLGLVVMAGFTIKCLLIATDRLSSLILKIVRHRFEKEEKPESFFSRNFPFLAKKL